MTAPSTTILLTILSYFVGCLIVLQASMNINLAVTLNQPIRSSCVSFWIGSVILGTALLVLPSRSEEIAPKAEAMVNKDSSRFSGFLCYLGGIYGAVYITCTIFIVPYIGFSIYFVCLITGQLLAALLIDLFGWLGSEKRAIHIGRVCGLLLTILGGVLLLLASNDKRRISVLLMCVLIFVSLISGTLLPIQSATNNLLRSVRRWGTLTVTAYSFVTSALLLTVAAAISIIYSPLTIVGDKNLWWHWLGGAIGIVYVAAGVKVSPLIGYATFYVAVIAGQLSLSLLSDAFGLLGPLKPSARSPMAICGVLVAACGAFLVSYFKAHQVPVVHIQEPPETENSGRNNVEVFAYTGDENL